MQTKKYNPKPYIKFNLLTLLIAFVLASPTIFVQKVSADFENTLANEVYKIAWGTINEKFFFKPTLDLTKWENKFENKIEDLNDAHKCINKLVKELKDPYTRFLTEEEFKDEQDIINSSFVGIGIKLATKKPVVVDVLSDSPALKEDIRVNDYLLRINGKSTRGLTISETINLLRGPKNTVLTVTIKRENEILNKTLNRQELNFKAVSSEFLENNLALVKIDSFIPENTSKLFRDELIKLMSAKGLIIDLRNNSGGLYKNAVEIADMFLSEGKIVSTINNYSKVNEYANSSQLFNSKIIILVNENTASASEIFASALKENNRATILGRKTFGKGLVQEIVKLPDDSALHVTIGAYLTPSGKNINKIGIIPDEVVYSDEEQVKRAKEILLGTKDALIASI